MTEEDSAVDHLDAFVDGVLAERKTFKRQMLIALTASLIILVAGHSLLSFGAVGFYVYLTPFVAALPPIVLKLMFKDKIARKTRQEAVPVLAEMAGLRHLTGSDTGVQRVRDAIRAKALLDYQPQVTDTIEGKIGRADYAMDVFTLSSRSSEGKTRTVMQGVVFTAPRPDGLQPLLLREAKGVLLRKASEVLGGDRPPRRHRLDKEIARGAIRSDFAVFYDSDEGALEDNIARIERSLQKSDQILNHGDTIRSVVILPDKMILVVEGEAARFLIDDLNTDKPTMVANLKLILDQLEIPARLFAAWHQD